MRTLVQCQGCGSKVWVDKDSMMMPRHRKADRSRCPMSQQKVEEK
jgi:hypothetical protein